MDTRLNPYQINKDGITPIQQAVKNQNWEEVISIASMPALNHDKARSGYALLIAAKENQTQVANALLAKVKDFSFSTSKNGYLPQHWAVANNNLAMLEALLVNGANADAQSKYHQTPLMLAVTLPDINPDIVQLLCKQNRDIERVVKEAAQESCWSIVTMLLDRDSEKHPILLAQLLFIAIDQDNTAMLTWLLDKGVAINYLEDKTSAIAHAAYLGRWTAVDAIASHANGRFTATELGNALVAAVAKQEWAMASKILKMKPKLDRKFENYSVAEWCIRHNNVEFLNELRCAGVDVTHHLTDACQMAISLGAKDVFKMLCHSKANVDKLIESIINKNNLEHARFLFENDDRDHSKKINELLYDLAKSTAAHPMLAYLLGLKNVSPVAAYNKAVADKSWEIVKVLVTLAPDILKPRLTKLFKPVIDDNKPDMVQFLLENGANPYVSVDDDRSNTPARYTANQGRWDCAHVLIRFPSLDMVKSNVGCVLLVAASQKKWELTGEIIRLKPEFSWKFPNSGYYTLHYLVAEKQYDLLHLILENGVDVNQFLYNLPSALDVAEEKNDSKAIHLLVKYGADHNNKIIDASHKKEWDVMFALIKKHYEEVPNRNETPIAKRTLLGKLLHIVAEHKHKETFEILLSQGASIRTQDNNNALLVTLVKFKSTECMDALIAEFPTKPPFSRKEINSAVFEAVQLNAPQEILERVVAMAGDLKEVKDSRTGGNLLHAAVLADNAPLLEEYVKLGIDVEHKNYNGLTPYSLLLKLNQPSDSKLKNAEAMSLTLAKTATWIEAQKFEKGEQNVHDRIVITSREVCLERLRVRYPHADKEACLKQYRDYAASVFGSMEAAEANGAFHRFELESVKNALPYIWMAVTDQTAFSEGMKLPPLPHDADPNREQLLAERQKVIDSYVDTRKSGLVDAIIEAKVMNSCDNGVTTKFLDALTESHPDVHLLYTPYHIKCQVEEDIKRKMLETFATLLSTLSIQEQRQAVHDYQTSDGFTKVPKFFDLVSKEIAKTIRPQYAPFDDFVKVEEVKKLLAPDSIVHLPFTWPAAIKNVIDLVTDIHNLSDNDNPFRTKAMELATNAYNVSDRTWEEEGKILESALVEYVDSLSSKNLVANSLLSTSVSAAPIVPSIHLQNGAK